MNIQLANEYTKYMAKRGEKPAFWWVSPKLDGIRAFKRLGEPIDSRAGNRFYGFEDIEGILDSYMRTHGITWVDGELFTSTLAFQEIQSIVRKAKHPDKHKVAFHMFACGDNGLAYPDWMARHLYDAGSFFAATTSRVKHVPLYRIKETDVEGSLQFWLDAEYEGIMLRHPDKLIQFKRNDALLKYKPFNEADFTIRGSFQGRGHISGMLGGFYVEGVVDGKRIRSKVGSGFAKTGELDSRDSLWHLALEGLLEGNLVEIKYQEITDKPDKEGYYSLRFPVFVKFKQDR